MKHGHQKGFLLIAAIVLIVMVGLIFAVINHLLTGSALTDTRGAYALQSYYVSESGLAQGLQALYARTISERGSCSVGSSTDFGRGQFQLTQANTTAALSTLTSAISAMDGIVPIVSSTGFLSTGRAYLGNELIDYRAISSVSTNCSPYAAPCLTGVSRGLEGTLASTHTSSSSVTQLACRLTSLGSVPSFNQPEGSTILSADENLEIGFIVGGSSGSNLTFLRWNQPTVAQISNDSITNSVYRTDLRAVALAGPSNAFAVGEKRANEFALWRWNPNLSSWVRETPPALSSDYYTNLYGANAPSTEEVWAVGQRSADPGGPDQRRWTILRRTGGSWCALAPSGSCGGKSIPPDSNSQTKDLYAVSVIDTDGDGLANFGFAVGDSGAILQYNGTAWSIASSPTSRDLFAVKVVSAQEAWAAGSNGTVLRWTASGGWVVLSGTGMGGTDSLRAITLLDTTGDGYAHVGWIGGYNGSQARAYRFTHTNPSSAISWANHSPVGSSVDDRIYAMAMLREHDVWATENNSRMVHWNGSSWELVARPSGIGSNLYGIALSGPYRALWHHLRETFN